MFKVAFSLPFLFLSFLSYGNTDQAVDLLNKNPLEEQSQDKLSDLSSDNTVKSILESLSNNRDADVEIYHGFYAQASSQERDEVNVGAMYLRAKINYRFFSVLNFYSDFKLQMKTGQIQQRFNQYHLKHSIYAYGFGLSFQPVKFLDISVGSINQSFLKSDLFIDGSWGFLGLKETLYLYKSPAWNLKLISQQSLPHYDVGNDHLTRKEKAASVMTNTAEFTVNWKDTYLNFFGTYYRYYNLPSFVAFESGLLGNDIKEESEGYRFVNDFYGYIFGLDGDIDFSNYFSLFYKAYHVRNYATHSERADAQWIEGGFNYKRFEMVNIKAAYVYFFNESAVSPAYYNSKVYGGSNREGISSYLSVGSDKYGFHVSAKYVKSSPVTPNMYQQDLNYFVFKAEVLNAYF